MVGLWLVLANASDNGVLDLGPLATDVAWFVVVTGARGRGDGEGVHLEDLVILLVLPVGTGELEQGLAIVDLGLGPAQQLVRDVVLGADVTTFLLLITQCLGIADLIWAPLVSGWLVLIVTV